jgi:hypothetical protein
MDKREYLRAHGFSVGSRGRFSKEMLKVLEDYVEDTTIDDSNPDYTVIDGPEETLTLVTQSEYPSLIKNDPVIRPARILKGFTSEGYVLSFVSCSDCHNHMIYCSCAGGVKAPSSVIRSADPLVRV